MPTGVYKRPLKLCSREGCDEKHHAKGLCGTHYRRKYMKNYMTEYRENNHRKKENKKKPQFSQKRTRMECLNFDVCGNRFMSSGSNNRICPACRRTHSNQGFYVPIIYRIIGGIHVR